MPKDPMQKAVVYCRVSDSKQVSKGDGLTSQETRCREFAGYKGYDVIQVFKEDMSGKFASRPAMTDMLRFLRQHRKAGIVVIIDDISRLARGLEAHLKLRASLASAGGKLESPSIEFGEDSDSLLVENMLASVAQHHREKNGEQTTNRMRARMQNGYYVFNAPIGYTYEARPGNGSVLVRDEPSCVHHRRGAGTIRDGSSANADRGETLSRGAARLSQGAQRSTASKPRAGVVNPPDLRWLSDL